MDGFTHNNSGVLVTGAEGSGTRLMTRVLLAAGYQGSDAHDQPFDHELPRARCPVVWRRSMPHGGAWPMLSSVVKTLRAKAYRTQTLIMVRDWSVLARSQVAAGHTPHLDAALDNIREAYRKTLIALSSVHPAEPFLMVSYEALVNNPDGTLALVMLWLGAPVPDVAGLELYDGNARHYPFVQEMEPPDPTPPREPPGYTEVSVI